MAAKSDFWLYVHDLASCLRRESLDADEALRNIAFAFHSLPTVTRGGLEEDLQLLIDRLPDLKQSLRGERASGPAQDSC